MAYLCSLLCVTLAAVTAFAPAQEADAEPALETRGYDLAPRQIFRERTHTVLEMSDRIAEVLTTSLGLKADDRSTSPPARSYDYDREQLQLMITDHADNHVTVAQLLTSLDRPLQKLAELARRTSITRTIQCEGEILFNPLRLRLTRVEPNNMESKSDRVEMVVRTPVTSEDFVTIEGTTRTVEGFDIEIEEVLPAGVGEGTARITVRRR